jgi:hypothetical protein
MEKNKSKKRFLSIRLTPEELQQVKKLCKSTTCRSLTEYTIKVLTRKPVIVRIRNESADQLLLVFIEYKCQLEALLDQLPDTDRKELLSHVEEVKTCLIKTYAIWSPK